MVRKQVDEFWKPVPGFPGYEASDHGNIRKWNKRKKEWQDVPQSCRHKSFRKASLKTATRSFSIGVHVIICRTFKGGAPSDKHFVVHQNGKKWDNRAKNLRWAAKGKIVEIARCSLPLDERPVSALFDGSLDNFELTKALPMVSLPQN